MMRTGWRIVPSHRVDGAFDGEGARIYGGRWNSVGIAMAYASEHQSLAALEVRVHIEKTSMRKSYKCIAVHFDERLMQTLPLAALPKEWRQEPPPPAAQRIGDDWIRSGRSVVLAVPSAIIPDELTYLINPKHPEFGKLKFERPKDFTFDQRLFV